VTNDVTTAPSQPLVVELRRKGNAEISQEKTPQTINTIRYSEFKKISRQPILWAFHSHQIVSLIHKPSTVSLSNHIYLVILLLLLIYVAQYGYVMVNLHGLLLRRIVFMCSLCLYSSYAYYFNAVIRLCGYLSRQCVLINLLT